MTYIKAATLVLVASIYGGGNVQCEQAIPFASTLFERRSLQHRLEKQHAELCARNVAACREFRGVRPGPRSPRNGDTPGPGRDRCRDGSSFPKSSISTLAMHGQSFGTSVTRLSEISTGCGARCASRSPGQYPDPDSP